MSSGRLPLLIVFVTVFIDLLGFGIVLPLLPRYAEYLKASGHELGVLMASFSAMQFIFALIWGRVSDRVGRRPILLLGLLGSTASYALFGFVSTLSAEQPWQGLTVLQWLLVSRIGAGIFGATIPTAQAFIADVTPAHERGKGMALIGAAFGIGFTFGPILGAACVSADPKATPGPWPGYLAASLSAVAFIFALWKLPESLQRGESATKAAHRRWLPLGKSLLKGTIPYLLLTISLTTFAFAQFEGTLARLTSLMGYSDRGNFFVFAFIGLTLIICQGGLVRRLMPIWGEYRLACVGVVAMVAGLFLTALAGELKSPLMLWLVLPIQVMGFSALNPALASQLSRRARPEDQGEILGFGQSASSLARILGPYLGNILFVMRPTYPYWIGGVVMLLGMVAVILTGRDEPAQPSETVPVTEG